MVGHTNRVVLIDQSPVDGLANPPTGIGRKLDTALGVESLHGPHEPSISLLDEIQKGEMGALVAFGHVDHQTQVGENHLRLGLLEFSLRARESAVGSAQGRTRWASA